MTPQHTAQALAEALCDEACAAMSKAGFTPSERLKDKLFEEILAAISLT